MRKPASTTTWCCLAGALLAALAGASQDSPAAAASVTAAPAPAGATAAAPAPPASAPQPAPAPGDPATATAVAATRAPRVHVASGTLVGVERDGVLVFAGVPFAAPPVGELRWQAPRPPLAWTGERAAVEPGPSCMQPNGADAKALSGVGAVSEDCLTLQVFAPKAAPASAPAPVLVWVHGGSNLRGGGARPVYDGTAFARDGVVLVSINYRLGVFGFFGHPALTRAAAPDEPLGAYALMDQLAALRWVRRNISAFGGDPERVTVFGESAGGGDIMALLAAPASHGLFAGAIAESAGGGWEPLPNLAETEDLGVRIVKQAGLAAGAAATTAALRALPADRLLAAEVDGYSPILDGRFIPENPTAAFAAGHIPHVALLLGSNDFEASLVRDPAVMLKETSAATRDAYVAADPAAAASDRTLGAALFGDHFFTAPSRWFARHATAAGSPAWVYRFSYLRRSQRETLPGAPHGAEIPHVFASWEQISPLRAAFLPAEDREMTALVHSIWVAFARTGNPSVPALPTWRPYSPQTDEVLELGLTTALRPHFRRAQLDAQERAAIDILHAPPPP